MRNFIGSLIAVFIFTAAQFFAQRSYAQSVTAAVKQHLYNYNSKAIQEKIYLHTDKNFYQTGEIIWFKAYAVDASFHKPLDLSKVVYVELLDKSNHPVLQAKIKMDSAEGNGSFYVPVNLNSGSYQLRAYTNWMKNFDEAFFFRKTIMVINAQKLSDVVKKNIDSTCDIQFFPEGGNLVNGFQSKVAFKVNDKYGKGVDCSGSVVNENGETVVSFQALKFGMGSFVFMPGKGHLYKAIIRVGNGHTISKPLPAAFEKGMVMTIQENAMNINVMVKANVDERTVYLVAQTRGVIKKMISSSLENGAGNFVINKGDLSEGITQLTLFNENKQPVCERLYFVFPLEKDSLQVQPDKENYGNRSRVKIDVRSSNVSKASASVAVYRIDSLQQFDDMNVGDYLLLSSDLKGSIESPSYYFSKDKDAVAAVDNLMLTQGWRRFDWKSILQDGDPSLTYEPEIKAHIVNAKVIDVRNGLPATGVECYLSVPGTRAIFLSNLSNDSGHVKFEMRNMYGAAEVIAQTNSMRDSVYRIDVQNPFSEKYTNDSLERFYLPVNNPATLAEQSVATQVQNIYTGNRQRQFTDTAFDTSLFYAKPDLSYLLDNYVRFTTMEEVLREYVQLVNVRRRGGKYHFDVYDNNSQKMLSNDPLVLLDGVPVFDMDKMIAYDPLKVRQLDVLTRRFYFSHFVYDGVLNFVTYKGDLPGYELDPKATVFDYESLQSQREFYSPKYETDVDAASHLPDFRNVLFWSPSLKLTTGNVSTIEFYTSDKKGKYVVVVQGIDVNGKCLSGTHYFEVK